MRCLPHPDEKQITQMLNQANKQKQKQKKKQTCRYLNLK